MLSSLHIRNFAIIDTLEVEFTHGLNVVTGETGAGKSIILGALQLLLGQRADKALIRNGTDSCDICGYFQFEKSSGLLKKVNGVLSESGAPPCEEGQLIVARKLNAKVGKNYVNSMPVALSLLATLGELLVDVHGPYDHQSLIQPLKQLELLDAFGNIEDCRKTCSRTFKDLHEIRREIDKFNTEIASPDRIDVMRFQSNEIRTSALGEHEEEELTSRHAAAARRHEILDILNSSVHHLNADDGILNQIAVVMRELSRLQHLDQKEGPLHVNALEQIYDMLNEFSCQLSSYATKIDIDPAAFAEMEDRLALIQRLKQKYGATIKAIHEYAERIEHELTQLENKDERLQQLKKRENEIETVFFDQARSLSNQRQIHALKLEKLITKKLQNLGFKDGLLTIKVDEIAMNSTGINSVEFQFGPNPGEGCKPLKDIASAGEISRVMLAIKTILAKADQIPVLVFDEIDVNVGGKVAGKVGLEMAKLGRRHQIICITHLPQVAAQADRHFLVDKKTIKGRTKATLTPLTNEARVQEIARMLGGAKSTSVTLRHASELLQRT